ncbi:MAG: rod shape-determining protein MreD [Geobacteraceae bacterium]
MTAGRIITGILKLPVLIALTLILQVTLLPAYLSDPFQPNLLNIWVVYLGLRGKEIRFSGALSFLLGLLQDCFSGLYLGLNGFSSLLTYLILRATADRLYTGSRYLLILLVFLSTVGNGLLQLLMLLLFSSGDGLYAAILHSLLPQALLNALATSLLLNVSALMVPEEKK